MKKKVLQSLLLLMLALVLIGGAFSARAKEKVLLDTDMVESFDDGVAMQLLALSPKIDLLAVTTVSGNYWVEMCTAHALYQLEIFGRTDIPVAQGMQYPLRPSRHEQYDLEKSMYGLGYDLWIGSFGLEKPKSWQDAYRDFYKKAPRYKPVDKHAVNMIIDTIRANPHEVTVAVIGPCTNMAMAVRMAPDIIPLIKRVVYMGGTFYRHGNATHAAEYNWWFDPEAARIMIRTPFKEQVIFSLDVCEKVPFLKQHYDRLLKTAGNFPVIDLLRNKFIGKGFESDPSFSHFVWDVLVAAYIIDPTLITKTTCLNVDINDSYGLSYGQSLAYPRVAPQGTQKCKIVLDVDVNRFWDMLNEKRYWSKVEK